MIRPAESPGGFGNTDPALARRAGARGASARSRRSCARTPRRRSPATTGTSAPVTTSAAPSAELAVPEVEARSGRVRPPRGPVRRGRRRAAAHEHLGGLAPVAAGVHPDRAADAARGSRRRTRGPVRPAAAARRREDGSGTAPPARTVPASASRSSVLELAVEHDAPSPANPASATSRFEPRPTTSSGGACAVGPRRRRRASASSEPARTSDGDRPTDVVGGEAATRHVALHRRRGRARSSRDRDRRRRCPPRSCLERQPLVGHGGEIAGAERQHDVAGPGEASARARRGRRGAGGRRRPARGARRARRAGPAGPRPRAAGVSPAAYTSVSTTASAPTNASAKSRQSAAVRV